MRRDTPPLIAPKAPAVVAAAFDSFPTDVRDRLLHVRDLILATAAATAGVGAVEETLKWGEPAYLTGSGSGSTIRLGIDRPSGAAAVHFICHTNLVDDFRRLYPDALAYAGNRSILLDGDTMDGAALRHCIALALTYHARKKVGHARKKVGRAA